MHTIIDKKRCRLISTEDKRDAKRRKIEEKEKKAEEELTDEQKLMQMMVRTQIVVTEVDEVQQHVLTDRDYPQVLAHRMEMSIVRLPRRNPSPFLPYRLLHAFDTSTLSRHHLFPLSYLTHLTFSLLVY